ncbi:MAG TPA: hypothetical protein VFJ04_06345 [Rhodanobacteraceae bacterium]|nr:hypothetical protein [Rhodanobacteraceae bacterium]
MQRTRFVFLPALAGVVFALGAANALSRQTPPPTIPPVTSGTAAMPAAMGTSAMPMPASSQAMGVHDMPGTVTSIDKSTGMIRVTTEGKQLRLHFPPASLANVNKGDTITLHLSFSK